MAVGELQKRLKTAEHYAEHKRLKNRKALKTQGFSLSKKVARAAFF